MPDVGQSNNHGISFKVRIIGDDLGGNHLFDSFNDFGNFLGANIARETSFPVKRISIAAWVMDDLHTPGTSILSGRYTQCITLP
jgi:hypothetical protein